MDGYGPTKGERREAKRHKKRHGMRVRGRSLFTIQEILLKRAEKAAAKKRAREERWKQ